MNPLNLMKTFVNAKMSFIELCVVNTVTSFSETHTPPTFWQAHPRQLMGPIRFHWQTHLQWDTVKVNTFFPSLPLTPRLLHSSHQTSASIPVGPPLKTTAYTPPHTDRHTHTHWLTTEAEAWWSHTNKAATGNTWCCDSTSSVPAEDIKNGCPPDHPTVKWVTVNRCAVAQIKFRPVCFLYSLLLMFIAICSFWRPQWIKKGKQCQNDVLQLRFYKQVITSSWVYNYSTVQ